MSPDSVATTLRKYTVAYTAGKPLVSDQEFDALREELKATAPDHPYFQEVGAPAANTLKKVKHAALCGSLDNTFDAAGITAWVEKIRAAGARHVVIQPKMDGLTLVLTYTKGWLVRAATRGDGWEGEDVSANAHRIPSVPKALSSDFSGEVRGECVILRKKFEEHFKPAGAANPRNAAAGTIRRTDGKLANKLHFLAFDLIPAYGTALPAAAGTYYPDEASALNSLERLGFSVCAWDPCEATAIDIIATWEAHGQRKNADDRLFDVDGMVVKVNNRKIAAKLGVQDGCPRGALACKWRDTMVSITVIRAVDNQVGRTGRITPVAVMDTVNCGGVQITRASLKNWDEIGRLEAASGIRLAPGATVQIARDGDVVPAVKLITQGTSLKNVEPFTRPDACPSCGAEAYESGPFQVCKNPSCPAQTFRTVMNWVKSRNILHLGEKAVDALMALDGPVTTIADLYTLGEDQVAHAVGSRLVAKKIVQSLEKSSDCTLAQVVGGIGIPGIGVTEATAALSNLGVKKSVKKLLSYVDEAVDPQLGEVTSKKFLAGVNKQRDLLTELSQLLNITADVVAATGTEWSGKTYCITGATDIPRETLKGIISKAGGIWKSSVVNDLDFLIVAASDLNTTKALTAKKKGIAVITEPNALDMAGYK